MQLSKLLKKKLHLTASASMEHIFSYNAKLTYCRSKEIQIFTYNNAATGKTIISTIIFYSDSRPRARLEKQ